MCFGGGGGGGTIIMPDTRAYDRQFETQKALIDSQMNSGTQAMQAQLDDALRQQQNLLSEIRDAKIAAAEDQSEEGAVAKEVEKRVQATVGPPPPERTAQAPVVGSADIAQARGAASTEKDATDKPKGKKGLRIPLTNPKKPARKLGEGVGLNIV